jgi:uncharacterized protein YyaL (SSP411 family)
MAADLASYLARRMTAPDGGFYTAEDADIDGKEGETYLWTRAEITEVLGSADADRLFRLYELIPLPSEPSGPGVLRIRQDQAASAESRASLPRRMAELAPSRARLLEARDGRPQPVRDDKIVVALNGLAIAGLARAGKALGEPQWIASASRAGEFLWQHAFDEKSGRLRHHLFQGEAAGEGFLTITPCSGLIPALGEATDEPVWQARARALASAIMARFIKADGLAVTSTADANLLLPAIDLDDHEMPAGTSAAYALLAQLGKADALMPRRRPDSRAHGGQNPNCTRRLGKPHRLRRALRAPAEARPEAALDSAAHVKAAAHGASHADHDEIVVTLTIDPSYHLNANPASADYLMPTLVTIPARRRQDRLSAGQVFAEILAGGDFGL